MVLTRAQLKRKAAGEPIYTAPPARRERHGKQATRITDLPDELLLQIVGYLESPDYLYSFSSLCLVSRRFNQLAVPALYKLIDFDDRDSPVMRLLLRSILHSPDLGSLTKHLDCSREKYPVPVADVQRTLSMIKGLDLPDLDR